MKKILIIDYDQNSLSSLQGIFAKQGYEVVTAADGQTGWDKYNKECPDLVLMEAMLPKVHGFELCQRITSERNTRATVFIMTGVYKDRVYRTEALRTYGASEYFEKPLKMAELLASVEAVLGRPEPRPAPEPPAPPKPAPVVRPEPFPVEPRKPGRAKSEDSLFALPEDLDRLSREMPKPRKPAQAHHDAAPEQRFDALADALLKKVVETTAAKAVPPKPGNGNGNGNSDIDQFLKSALAGLELDKEKVKAPKTAPLPPKPSPARPPHPPASFEAPPAKDMKATLTPGDPGSDVSPFYTPEKSKPARPAPVTEKTAGPALSPARREPPPRQPVRPEPSKSEPAKREPLPSETKAREAKVIASTGMFETVGEAKKKGGFPKIIVAVLGVAALAAVGYVLLRPKRPAPVQTTPQEVSQVKTPAENPPGQVEEAPPLSVKPAPVKQKAQPQAKPADPEPARVEAILPTGSSSAGLPLPGSPLVSGTGGDRNSQGASPPPAGADDPKTQAAPPAVKTEANPAGAAEAGSGTAPDPGAAAASAPAATPVKEGDLIELGAATEPPKLVKTVEPIYPPMAQRVGREGSITVNALIDEKGAVIDTGILKGLQDDRGLGKAAETAVRKWKFQPARKNGVAVKVWKSIVIVFKADQNPANTME